MVATKFKTTNKTKKKKNQWRKITKSVHNNLSIQNEIEDDSCQRHLTELETEQRN